MSPLQKMGRKVTLAKVAQHVNDFGMGPVKGKLKGSDFHSSGKLFNSTLMKDGKVDLLIRFYNCSVLSRQQNKLYIQGGFLTDPPPKSTKCQITQQIPSKSSKCQNLLTEKNL